MRELELLAYIYGRNAELPDRVTIPPGDDMGGLRFAGQTLLVTVDQAAEGVHVDCAAASLEQIGRKAVTRNLSDVAAMAARPLGAVAAACLPRGFGERRTNELFEAMRAAAHQFDAPLVGGDISIWDHPLLLSVTVFAEPAGVEPVLRSGAQAGDVICVTGRLGGAWQGGATAHLEFEPRIELARSLAKHADSRPSSMIDLSDGLGADLVRICERSGVAAEIDVKSLPLRDEVVRAAEADGRPGWWHALHDGEDYELCFTLSPEAAERLPRSIDGVTISRVGRAIEPAGGPTEGRVWLRRAGGERQPMSDVAGWQHTGDP